MTDERPIEFERDGQLSRIAVCYSVPHGDYEGGTESAERDATESDLASAGFVPASRLEAAEAMLEDARRELTTWEELVAASAPLTWAASHDTEAAHEWEKRAADMLTRRAKLLSLARQRQTENQ